ncbi:hypothetical protein LQ236_001126 [Nitrospina gracilis]|nr:hypothetical protein [Nitrospina sp. Nb-3]
MSSTAIAGTAGHKPFASGRSPAQKKTGMGEPIPV